MLQLVNKTVPEIQVSKQVVIDVLWGQLIKLVQVAFTSELRKNQWNDLLFFEIVISVGPQNYKH